MCQCNVVSKLYPSFPKLSQSWPNIVLSCVKVVLEVPTNCPLSQSYLKVVPKSSQNCIKVVPQLCPSCPKVPIAHCACGANKVSSGVHELGGTFFVWRAPIMSWLRIMCSQVHRLWFLTVVRNVVNKSVWRKKRLFLTSLKQTCIEYLYLSTVLREPEHGSLRIRAHLSWRTGKHLHVLHVLRTYSTCSNPGW